MKIRITPFSHPNLIEKKADAEIVIESGDLAGLRLLGFQLWEPKTPDALTGDVKVTFPARSFKGTNDKNSFYQLVRPLEEHDDRIPDALRHQIADAYRAWKASQGKPAGKAKGKPAPKAPAATPGAAPTVRRPRMQKGTR